MKTISLKKGVLIGLSLIFIGAVIALLPSSVSASHSWGGYHWARTASPLQLKLGDNVNTAWDGYLSGASTDWNISTVLHTNIVSGGTNSTKGRSTPKNCVPTSGRVEVCNASYGNTGWLGIASIWASGTHITQGTVKVNDTYFNTAAYNTPAWKRLVMCQEVAHTFGLDHQDEIFNNPNLGTCMDYTNDPDGTLANPDQLSNEHPNAHDFEELGIIYAHLDSTNTASQTTLGKGNAAAGVDLNNPTEWGKVVRSDAKGRPSLLERDLGNENKVFTFVIWAN